MSSSNHPDSLRQAPSLLCALSFLIIIHFGLQHSLKLLPVLHTCRHSTTSSLDLSLSLLISFSAAKPRSALLQLLPGSSNRSLVSLCPPHSQVHSNTCSALKRKSTHGHLIMTTFQWPQGNVQTPGRGLQGPSCSLKGLCCPLSWFPGPPCLNYALHSSFFPSQVLFIVRASTSPSLSKVFLLLQYFVLVIIVDASYSYCPLE